jgi:hypothetical protein
METPENPAEGPWQPTENGGEIEKLRNIIEEKNELIESLLKEKTRMAQQIQVFQELLEVMDQIIELFRNGQQEN